jgi:hypothetical protein
MEAADIPAIPTNATEGATTVRTRIPGEAPGGLARLSGASQAGPGGVLEVDAMDAT